VKILLIDPPFKRFTGFVNFYFPTGLAYLAAVLKNAGYKVSIFDVDAVQKGTDIDFSDEYRRLELYRQGLNDDGHIVWQDIYNVLQDFDPDLVGITAMTTKFGSVLKTAQVVKKYKPECKVIVGGPHPTFLPEQTLKSKAIDIVVRGEGERTFLNLIKAIEDKNNFQNVKGISFKQNGSVCHNPSQEFIEDLDLIPFPARDTLMNSKNYSSEDMGIIMTSRGCPFNCSYCCHMWQKKVRNRSIDNVIAEIKQVKQKYATRQFEFKDDTFTLNKKRIKRLCERLTSERINISWSCSTRVDLLDEQLVKTMKKAGCNVVKLGIETGSERILTETKKGVTFNQVKEAARLLNKHRIFWSGYFMMGLPTETEEDIRKTYEFMKELNPYYAGLGVYNPFPQTDLFEQGVRMGLLHSEVELDHFFNTNPKDYFFIDPLKRVAGVEKQRFDELVAFLRDGFHRHNTRIGNIIRRGWVRKQVYSRDLSLLFNDIRKAFKWMFSKM
jgi:radical SAM superfamily enzyme YgiQ (UPF0313 family)